MCLAVPARILSRDGAEAVVSLHGSEMKVSTLLTPEAKVGDWVLIHAGFVIQVLDEEAAGETFAVLADLEDSQRGATDGSTS
jgi:hydrogenase expression/formation protein HypC